MKPLIIIAGPTATGKSDAALELADFLETEIVSADSMQVYKQMDIGTAKPSKAELSKIKHHMIDIVDPDYPFNAAIYYKQAKAAIDSIHQKAKTPILVGGTGFYINALFYGNVFESDGDALGENHFHIRNELSKCSPGDLFSELLNVDPEYAKTTHQNNVKRVIRALSYYLETGERFSLYNSRSKEGRTPVYDSKFFILNCDRDKLYYRINIRVDKMISDGLIEEVEALIKSGVSPGATSMQGLGYKEVCAYLLGSTNKQEAINMIKQGSRRFAKRQITWFKNQASGTWLDVAAYSDSAAIARVIMNYKA